jgi:hypothetical protein
VTYITEERGIKMALVKTTENKGELVLNEAPFKEVLELKKAIQENLKSTGLSLDSLEGEDVSSALQNMIDLLLVLDTSERTERAIFECLVHCTYNNAKINEQLFNDLPEARADYYEIIRGCIEVNLRPFMKSLSSQFPILTVFGEIYQSMLSQQNGESK